MNVRCALSFGLVAVGVVLAADAPEVPTPQGVLDNYKKLERVTREPKSVGAEFAGRCLPTPAMDRVQKEAGRHAIHYLHYYLNEAALRYFKGGTEGGYPEGSVIVKEKLFPGDVGSSPDFTQVNAVTGMIKGAPGSSPKTGDWQFFYFRRKHTYDQNGKAEPGPWIPEKELQGCAGCHSSAKDMVFGRFDKPYQIPKGDEEKVPRLEVSPKADPIPETVK